ncbi:MAG: hypothetical protein WCV62_06415 [Candidatus Peribacteraceae bacterium]|jgi:hypothetical protein
MRLKYRQTQLLILGITLASAVSGASLLLKAELTVDSYDTYINASIRVATETAQFTPCLLLTFECPTTNTYSRTDSCIIHPQVVELDCGDTRCSQHTCLKKAAYFPDPEQQYGTSPFCALYRQCGTLSTADCTPGSYEPMLCESERCKDNRTDLPPCLWLTLQKPETNGDGDGSGEDDGTGGDNDEKDASSRSSSSEEDGGSSSSLRPLPEERNASGTVLFRSSSSSSLLRCTAGSESLADGTVRCLPPVLTSPVTAPALLPTRPLGAEEQKVLEAELRRRIEEKLVPERQVDDRLEQLRSHVEEATERLTLVASSPTLPPEAKEKILATVTWLRDVPLADDTSWEGLRTQKEAVQAHLRETNALLKEVYHRTPQTPPPAPSRLLTAADRVFAATPRILALLKQENVVVPMTAASTFAEAKALYAGIRGECVANANACDRIAETVPRLEQVLKMLKEALRSADREDLLQKMQEMMQE